MLMKWSREQVEIKFVITCHYNLICTGGLEMRGDEDSNVIFVGSENSVFLQISLYVVWCHCKL